LVNKIVVWTIFVFQRLEMPYDDETLLLRGLREIRFAVRHTLQCLNKGERVGGKSRKE
jgi:hypothetical protein